MTLRFNSRLHHIGVGRPYAGKRVIMLVAGRHVSVIGLDGSPAAPQARPDEGLPAHAMRSTGVYYVPRHLSPMSLRHHKSEGGGV